MNMPDWGLLVLAVCIAQTAVLLPLAALARHWWREWQDAERRCLGVSVLLQEAQNRERKRRDERDALVLRLARMQSTVDKMHELATARVLAAQLPDLQAAPASTTKGPTNDAR
jgi:hypothetical protein